MTAPSHSLRRAWRNSNDRPNQASRGPGSFQRRNGPRDPRRHEDADASGNETTTAGCLGGVKFIGNVKFTQRRILALIEALKHVRRLWGDDDDLDARLLAVIVGE